MDGLSHSKISSCDDGPGRFGSNTASPALRSGTQNFSPCHSPQNVTNRMGREFRSAREVEREKEVSNVASRPARRAWDVPLSFEARCFC
jgi:hypothetical protein